MADPNKWLGLLKWSMKYQDGTSPSPGQPISEEDKAWLDQVMEECVMDEVERMTQIIRILTGEKPEEVFKKKSDESESEPPVEHDEEEIGLYKESLLDELLTRIDQIDNAQTFVKIRGMPVILTLFEHERNSTKCLAAEVFATLVQNNPPCQKEALKLNSLEKLYKLFEVEDNSCKAKALLGISCLVRGCKDSEKIFVENGGLLVLKEALISSVVSLQRKAIFFLRFIVSSSVENAQLVYDNDFYLPSLIRLIGHEDVDLRESALSAITEFASIKPEFRLQCMEKDFDLENILMNRMKTLEVLVKEDDENAKIELEIAQILFKIFS